MNHYKVLGVSEKASQKEIKDAYKKLIKKYHPDIYEGDKIFAEQKTKEINLAYDTLSNEELKKQYDEELHPTPTYSYTPPQYYNPESYSYKEYYKNKYNNNNNFNAYNKTRTTSTSTYHNEFSNNVINSFNKFSFKKKIIILLVFFIIYTIYFLNSLFQMELLKKDNNGPITPPVTSITSNTNSHTNTYSNDITDNNSDIIDDEFNINDYFTEKQLHAIYEKNYKNIFNSYEDFKNAFSYYVYDYYYNF